MEIKNFLSILKRPSWLTVCVFIMGCQHVQNRDMGRENSRDNIHSPPSVIENTKQNSIETTKPSEPVSIPVNNANNKNADAAPEPSPVEVPKIGLILGPGSSRAMAHVGVVQELTRARLPITQIVGIEMGALIGAIYAHKAQAFDVEWQVAKLKDIRGLQSFLQNTFGSAKVSDLRLPFACPAFQLAKSQYLMMNKGVVTQMLPYCLSAPPTMKPYAQNVAAMTEIKSTSDYLKSKGANFIVYVNVLSTKNGIFTGALEDDQNILWALTAQALVKQSNVVDFVLNVPTQEFDLADWGQRRELIQRGKEAGQLGASQISKRLGF
jgi:NTE family protein